MISPTSIATKAASLNGPPELNPPSAGPMRATSDRFQGVHKAQPRFGFCGVETIGCGVLLLPLLFLGKILALAGGAAFAVGVTAGGFFGLKKDD